MPVQEFDLIERYFCTQKQARPDVSIGIGDDAALVRVPPHCELVISMDTMVEGVHFGSDVAPSDLGYKLLAVSLSDLAAMGAEPAWATLAITLPEINEDWVRELCAGLFELANTHGVQLIGGDTTSGPLTLTLQIHGFVPQGEALRRSGAQPGDAIYVTHCLGDAAFVLANWEDPDWSTACDALAARLHRPTPRLDVGQALRGLASAAIDISDGLVADLGHVLRASGVGASIRTDQIPLSDPVRRYVEATDNWSVPLASGDDYELCFAIPEENIPGFEALNLKTRVSRIGVIESESGLRVCRSDGTPCSIQSTGYQHFS